MNNIYWNILRIIKNNRNFANKYFNSSFLLSFENIEGCEKYLILKKKFLTAEAIQTQLYFFKKKFAKENTSKNSNTLIL